MFGYLFLLFTVAFVFSPAVGDSVQVHSKQITLRANISSKELLSQLFRKLKAAYEKGLNSLQQILDDPDVKDILEHLGPLSKRVAQAIINKFKELAKVIDEATKETQVQTFQAGEDCSKLLEQLKENMMEFLEFGMESVYEFLSSPEVQNIIVRFHSLYPDVVEEIIDRFIELVEAMEQMKEDKTEAYGFVGESASAMIKKIIQRLFSVYRQGTAAIEAVLNDHDVKEILDSLDSVSRRIAEATIKKIKEMAQDFTEESNTTAKRDLGEKTKSSLKLLVEVLQKAFTKGKSYFYKVLEDPDVKGIIDHLGPLSRRAAEVIIENFKYLLEKIDNSIGDDTIQQDSIQTYGLLDESVNLLKTMVQTLKVAYVKGADYLDQIITNPDFQHVLGHMNSLTRRAAEALINGFRALAMKIDEVTHISDEDSRVGNVLRNLLDKLSNAYNKGTEELNKVLNDEAVQKILQSLDSVSRRIADAVIAKLKEMAIILDEATKDANGLELPERFKEHMKKLTHILISAYRKGSAEFEKVLHDRDVKQLLEGLDSVTRKIADTFIEKLRQMVKNVDEATKEKRSVDEESFGVRERSADVIKKMIQKLMAVYKQGYEAVEKVLNDPDVKDILESMDSLSRRVVESIINKFKELAKKVDEATQEKRELEEESYVLREKATEIVKQLVQRLMAAYRRGYEDLEKVLNDDDVKAIIEGLDSISRRIVNAVIDRLREMAQPDTMKRGLKEDSKQSLKYLISILQKAFSKGKRYFYEVLEDKDVKNIIEHLGPLSRRIANSIIDNFKSLLEKINNSLEDEKEADTLQQLSIRNDGIELMKKIVRTLKSAYVKGEEYLNKVLDDLDFKKVLNRLNSINRRIVQNIIYEFQQLAKRIDEATKE